MNFNMQAGPVSIGSDFLHLVAKTHSSVECSHRWQRSCQCGQQLLLWIAWIECPGCVAVDAVGAGYVAAASASAAASAAAAAAAVAATIGLLQLVADSVLDCAQIYAYPHSEDFVAALEIDLWSQLMVVPCFPGWHGYCLDRLAGPGNSWRFACIRERAVRDV